MLCLCSLFSFYLLKFFSAGSKFRFFYDLFVTKASRWIHEYYTTPTTERSRTPSPAREWHRNTIGYSTVPDLYYTDYAYGDNFWNGTNTTGRKSPKGKGKGGNQYGTWSGGGLFDTDGKGTTASRKGKKKKWFKFGFTGNKNTMKKVKAEKENLEYSSTTLPLPKSASLGNLYTSSLRRRNKSEADVESARDWPLERNDGIDMVDIGTKIHLLVSIVTKQWH